MKAFLLVCISVLFIQVSAFSQVDTIPHTRNKIELKQMINLLENLNVKDDSIYLVSFGFYEVPNSVKLYKASKDTLYHFYREAGKTGRGLEVGISKDRVISTQFISLYQDDFKKILKEAKKDGFKEVESNSNNNPLFYRKGFANDKYQLTYIIAGKELKTYQVGLGKKK